MSERKFEQPKDGSCTTPISCTTACQDALAVKINPNYKPKCSHPEVQKALKERARDQTDSQKSSDKAPAQ